MQTVKVTEARLKWPTNGAVQQATYQFLLVVCGNNEDAEFAGVKDVGLEILAPHCRTGKCTSGPIGTRLARL